MTGKPFQAFDAVAQQYQNHALVQQKAAQTLIELLDLQGSEDVLDIGCGPGHITAALKARTRGRVMGTDISPGMIDQARAGYPGLELRQLAAEDLDFEGQFDVAFCNSTFQWFRQPDKALRAMHRLLRKGGRLGLACPTAWPTLERAVEAATKDPRLEPTFRHWKKPWFTLPGAEDYRRLLEQAGFATMHCEIRLERTEVSPEQAFQIYLSGAHNGYIAQPFYDIPVSEEYLQTFGRLVREEIDHRGSQGTLSVEFRRLFYLGEKSP